MLQNPPAPGPSPLALVKHEEVDKDPYEAIFHIDLVTDINPFEIIANGENSTARAALVIKRSVGAVYDPATAKNFLSISYEQATKTLAMSGIVFDLDDDGEQVYACHFGSLEDVSNEIMLWLGMDNKNGDWHGLGFDDFGRIVVLDYVLAKTDRFQDKDYYKREGDIYMLADDYTVGDPIPYGTYYVEAQPYESAKILFGDNVFNTLFHMITHYYTNVEEGGMEASAGLDMEKIYSDFSAICDLYNHLIEEEVISISLDPEFSFSADITSDIINDIIDVINHKYDLCIKHIIDPEYIKVYMNSEGYEDKAYITVKYDGNVYELTLDDSRVRTFGITFKLTLESGRTYTFDFEAVRSEDGATWFVETNFDIADGEGNVENSTTVRLTDFHMHWGEDYSARLDGTEDVDGLLPDLTDALPIFPAEDIPSVGNVLAKGLVDLLNNEKVLEVIVDVLSVIM